MNPIIKFEKQFQARLSETSKLLLNGNLVVHEAVFKITLHGSRGLAADFSPDSDIDLTLVVDPISLSQASDQTSLMSTIISTTLDNWTGDIELDIAVAFYKSNCGLGCFDIEQFDPKLCDTTINCMGLYKEQEGYTGLVIGAFLDVRKIYPLLVIWRKKS